MSHKTTVIIAPSKKKASAYIVDRLAEAISEKPNLVLGTATGGTMVPVYGEVCSRVAEGKLSLRDVSAYQLDEYYPIEPWSPQSYKYFMTEHLVTYTDMRKTNMHVLNGLTRNPHKTCRKWDKRLAATGGIDVQLLGIGVEGHIAFIEARKQGGRELLKSKTRLVDLDKSTIKANKRFFKKGQEQPKQALSVGIGTLLSVVEEFYLAAFELTKSKPIATALLDDIGDHSPASYIREKPSTVVLDKGAAVDLLFRIQRDGLPEHLTVECLQE